VDDQALYRLMVWGYATLPPIIVMYAVMAVVQHSSALMVCAVLAAVSLTVQTFSLYAMRQVLAADPYRFPYGAGKLEDFSAMLCGVLFVPSGACLALVAVERLADPVAVHYAPSLIAVAVSAVRMALLWRAAERLARRTGAQSPLVRAYLLDYRTSLLSDLGVLASFTVGWLLVHAGEPAIGDRVDPLVAVAIALYMVWAGVWLVRRSFRALADLPLGEEDQIRLMKVLAEHVADYAGIGVVHTRASGKRRVVEVEVAFPASYTLGELDLLRTSMERSLAAGVPGLDFRIVPLVEDPRRAPRPEADGDV
jgi:cation diffusion facilitator family transporter